MERRSAKIHSVITNIIAVSSPIDENGDPNGVWAMPEEGDDMSCMHDGPLVGNLSFPGHVMAFMRMMDGHVLYIDPQHTKAPVTVDRIAFTGVVSTQVSIGLSGPDTPGGGRE